MTKYDVIVIGAGSAGLGSAGVANAIGLKTLLIEKDANNFGGDCTNSGCVPSKALIHIAHHFHGASKATEFGLQIKGKADMHKVLKYIRAKQEIIRVEEDADALRKQGMAVEVGMARFLNAKTIEVNQKLFTARIILLCTGSSPRMISIPGMETMQLFTNESLFGDSYQLPDNLVVIGGGPIGCEMAQAFHRLGSQVTLVQRGERILPKEPEDVSGILQTELEKEGLKILCSSQVSRFEDGRAVIQSSESEVTGVACDAVLMAIGRVVNVKDMGLAKAGIELTSSGKIKVDKYLRTTNSRVYVLGDAAGSYMFSHGSEKMVRQLWRNLLIPIFRKENTTRDLSWVTFTDPQVAHFGWTEAELDDHGVSYYRQEQSLAADDRAIIEGYGYGKASYWLTTGPGIGNRKFISGSLIAPNAGEIIQELELAKHAGVPIKYITSRVYPYPVATRINQKTIRGLMNKTQTDWKKKLARVIFRCFH